jgi:hypothetical protein
LRSVEEAAARAEAALVRVRADLAAAAAELVGERRARRAAEERAAGLEARVRGLESERDAAHRRSAALATDVARLEATAAAVAAASAASAATRVQPSAPVAEPAVRPVPAVPEAQPEPERAPIVAPVPFDVEGVRRAVAAASSAAQALGGALAEAAAALMPSAGDDVDGVDEAPGSRRDRSGRARATVRRPAPLPPATFDDDPAAAAHLVRVPGCVLVVDGYNASLRRWPDEPIAEQRRRLGDALGALAARAGCDVHLVFDGTGDQGRRSPAAPRARVRVTFTPADVEADDAILELVDRLPVDRVVVVASDDRRVRAGAAERGANVIGQEQLFSLF